VTASGASNAIARRCKKENCLKFESSGIFHGKIKATK
jgi:hypothetical protein